MQSFNAYYAFNNYKHLNKHFMIVLCAMLFDF